MNRLPSWFRQDLPDGQFMDFRRLVSGFDVHTVCREAKCPNIVACFKNKKLTFMILGDTCTRNCRFCGVTKSEGPGLIVDEDEPLRISRAVEALGLEYVVITSVTRDDLADGGAEIFAKSIEAIRAVNKNIKIEVLIPDFCGKMKPSPGLSGEILERPNSIPSLKGGVLGRESIKSLNRLLEAGPDVIAHNIETVERLYAELRPLADYRLSLSVIGKIKELNPQAVTKSSIMLGLGEQEGEVFRAMEDLRVHNCDILTLGQYLAPSSAHYPVKEFISIGQFAKYQDMGLTMGFKSVLSGPLVRSSYKAEEVFKEFMHA